MRKFELPHAAEDAAAFLCSATWGHADAPATDSGEDAFYRRALLVALHHFAARVLCPARTPARESDVYALYTLSREESEASAGFNFKEYVRALDFLVLHKDYEYNARRYRAVPELIAEGRAYTGAQFEFVTDWLGRLLGTEMYDAYLHGRLHKRGIRSRFLLPPTGPGKAKAIYFRLARLCREPGRRLAS